jgi:nitric oxide reductase NorD protein
MVTALRSNPGTLKTWLKHVRALTEALGSEAAEGYTRLVVDALPSGDVAEELAGALPDLLAAMAPDERRRFQRMVAAVLSDSPEAAMSVAQSLPALLGVMDDAALAQFVARGLQRHEASPHRLDGFLRMESEASQQTVDDVQTGVSLASLHRPLSLYVRAHCGEAVQIRPGDGRAYTDGRHLYLPARSSHFGDHRDEDALWVMAALASGHIEFGSLNIDLDAIPGDWPALRPDEMPYERMLRAFDNTAIARSLFLLFEAARVKARVRKAYPGMARRMDALGPLPAPDFGRSAVDEVLAAIYAGLSGGHVDDVLAQSILAAHQPATWSSVHQAVAAVQQAYPQLRAMLKDAQDFERVPELGLDPGAMSEEDKAVERKAADLLARLDEEPDWEAARREVRSRDEDGLGYAEMSDFLERNEAPAGPLQNDNDDDPTVRLMHKDVDRSRGERRWRYPEWDDDLGDYKPSWVGVIEFHLAAGDTEFVDQVLSEHGPMIDRLRRTFEAMRPDHMRPKRGLNDGDTLDMDAVIAARIARRAGVSGPAGLYRARRPVERDVSVAFLVDMSSSTNEHINTAGKRIIDVEREALVVTAEAVDALGDQMAIYGYSGFGREAVAFYVAKEFTEPYGPRIRERIGRMGWKLENRDGAAIRHAVQRLTLAPSKTRLLILLSDGKPLDGGCADYNNHYAQMDTRMALIEARKAGVHPFCITVDPHARDYLRRMYGDNGYTIIDSVDDLPARLPALYRQLTA